MNSSTRLLEKWFVVLLIGFFVLFLILALQMPPGTGRLPMILSSTGVGLGVLLLVILQFFPASEAKSDTTAADDKAPGTRNILKLPELQLILWLLVFLLLIYLIGLTLAIPIFLFLLVYIFYKEKLRVAVSMAVGGVAVFYLLFVKALSMIPYPGMLFDML